MKFTVCTSSAWKDSESGMSMLKLNPVCARLRQVDEYPFETSFGKREVSQLPCLVCVEGSEARRVEAKSGLHFETESNRIKRRR